MNDKEIEKLIKEKESYKNGFIEITRLYKELIKKYDKYCKER